MNWKPSDILFARIKDEFASFDQNNLLDEGAFYHHVKYIINKLGLFCYQEKPTLVFVYDYQAQLPDDFSLVESAWLCEGSSNVTPAHFQNKTIVWNEKTCDTLEVSHCSASCQETENLVERITVKEYVDGIPSNYLELTQPCLLKISNNKTRTICSKRCLNLGVNCPDEISIEGKTLYANFQEGVIFLRYYAFPVDETTKLPLVPDNSTIEAAIEYYIKWKYMEQIWLNGDDVNVQQRVMYLRDLFENRYFKEAKFEVKLPSFSSMVKSIERTRRKFNIYELTT